MYHQLDSKKMFSFKEDIFIIFMLTSWQYILIFS